MTSLASFDGPVTAAVIGAGGGIGGAFVRLLAQTPEVTRLLAFSRGGRRPGVEGAAARGGPYEDTPAQLSVYEIDIEDEGAIARAAAAAEVSAPLHLVIVATGILHTNGMEPEKTWRALEARALNRIFRINTIGPALVMKHFLPLLDRERKAVFAALSARLGSITDNRVGGWYGYRASKAALNQMLRTAAVELARKNKAAICAGLHPGTVDTALSAPFQGNVPEGRLFTPDFAARRLLEVIDGLTPSNSGHVFAWDGAEVPP